MAEFNNTKKKNNDVNRAPKKDNRPRDFGSKRESIVKAPLVCSGIVEYTMSRVLAEHLLEKNKGKRPAQEVLCEYVNNNCGLKGYCVKVIVEN